MDVTLLEGIRSSTVNCGRLLRESIRCRYDYLVTQKDVAISQVSIDVAIRSMVVGFTKSGLCMAAGKPFIFAVDSIIGVEVDEDGLIVKGSDPHTVDQSFLKEYILQDRGDIVVVPDAEKRISASNFMKMKSVTKIMSNSDPSLENEYLIAYLMYTIGVLLELISIDRQIIGHHSTNDSKESKEEFLWTTSLFLDTMYGELAGRTPIVSKWGDKAILAADVYPTPTEEGSARIFDVNVRNVRLVEIPGDWCD